ncbi:GNAT family N-acetyltransferase [Heyndrickxia sp. MSNUG]|uniref:GNAT family N-acetyltransferase n=1 Tax=Heyndrickxia sp. MSNUG TaxID=3136677 RepID=UPI003C2E5CF3
MKLISHYRDNDLLRNSFIDLAHEIFGINFSSWHELGYWGNRYIPYSYADGDKIVANVSVNKLDFIIEGASCRALQIGTVMTHPDYRSKGLSAILMNHILEEYKDQYDFMYLFANDSVLDFYPKFGFERVEESLYTVKSPSGFEVESQETVNPSSNTVAGSNYPEYQSSGFAKESESASAYSEKLLRKLDISNTKDLQLVEKMVSERMPVSKVFGTANSGCISMFHVLNVFPESLYYSEQEDAVIIFSKEERTVHLIDLVSKSPINIEKILAAIADGVTNEIVFHYTPDYQELEYSLSPFEREGALFVKINGSLSFPLHAKHPVTSEA